MLHPSNLLMRRLVALVPLLVLQPLTAQEDTGTRIRVDVGYVIAPTTVTDRKGRYITGLEVQDFRLFDNGKPQKISEDIHSLPLSLVIAVQASAGMENVLPQVKKVGSLLETLVLGEGSEVAVVAFDHRIMDVQPFTTDREKVTEALGKLKPGSTSHRLNDAVMHSLNLLRNREKNRRKAILLIAETRDNSSEMSARQVITQAEFQNVVVYSVNVSRAVTQLTTRAQPPRPNPVPPEARRLPNGQISTPTIDAQHQMGSWVPALKELFDAAKGIFVDRPGEALVKYTGGREYSFVTQKALEQAVADLGEELQSQYLLSYRPNNTNEGGFHEIVVEVNRPGLIIRTRPGYWVAARPDGQ
jgi:VWFA-related protein